MSYISTAGRSRRPYSARSSRPTNSYRSGGGNRSRNARTKQNIHPSKFVRSAKLVEQEPYVSTHSFSDFIVHPLIEANLLAKGYVTPSPIQDQSIPHIMQGKDVIGIANTGTGKTAAFGIPLLHRLMEDKQSKALIIAPTRELAQQIEEELVSFAKGSGLFGAVLIGGSHMGTQIRDLRSNPSIVIGTPGRIKDHVQRGNIKLANFNMIVLDEVDRMVDMGFINDIRFLLGELSTKRQSLFFSATLDNTLQSLVHSFLTDPVTISVKTGDTGENIEQNVVRYQGTHDKLTQLHEILISDSVGKTLVFDETQRNVERLSKELIARGLKADAIHGGKTQGARQRALKRFRDNEVKVLVATDVAARGIDISDITHVINYSVPQSYDDYVHRIGRAGRAGKIGHALTFVN